MEFPRQARVRSRPAARDATVPAWAVILAAILASAALTPTSRAQEYEPRTFIEWETFGVGAWKQVRVYRETFDGDGKVASSSAADAKTTLQQIDEHGFTLRAEVTVEVAGKRFLSQPQVVWYGYHGESKGQTFEQRHLGAESIEVNSAKLPVEVFQITVREGNLRRDIRAYCSDRFPHVLRKESLLVDPSGEKDKEIDRVVVELIAMDLPHRVLADLKPACQFKTVRQRPDSQWVTVEVHCEEVPGRVVAHWSTKTDLGGRVIERSALELVDYGLGADPPTRPAARRPFFRRR